MATGVRDVFNHVLFEISTEVAHRVGGIYSVMKSKARYTTAQYGYRYTLLGPWNRASVRIDQENVRYRSCTNLA
jgi:glycogen(starch) synthase